MLKKRFRVTGWSTTPPLCIRKTYYYISYICSNDYSGAFNHKSGYSYRFFFSFSSTKNSDKWIPRKKDWSMHSLLCIIWDFFLWILPIFLSKSIAFVFLTISIILIWILAPYNHPNMNLSSDEARACEKSAKWRLMTLILFLNVSYVLKMIQFSLGILLGIILTALTLVMGYSM